LRSPVSTRGSKTLSWVLFLFLGILGIWHFHDSEFLSNFQVVPGGRGDNRLVCALLEYTHHAFLGAGHYFSPAFYFPSDRTLGYSDAYLAHAVLFHFLRAMKLDLFTSYQICVLVFNILNYLFCFLMLRKGFNFGWAASSVGAFLFAFNAPKFNQISHTQLQFLCCLPLAVWALAEWVKGAGKMGQVKAFWLLSAAGLCLNLQLMTAFYPAWFFLFWMSLFFLLSLCLKSTRQYLAGLLKSYWQALTGAAIVFLAGLIPFLWLYLPVARDLGGKDYSEVKMMIPTLGSFLWMGPGHKVWGRLWDQWSVFQSFPIENEARMGFGLALSAIILVAAFAALWIVKDLKNKKKNRFLKTVYDEAGENKTLFMVLTTVTTVLFCVIACQYPGDFSPWRWVFDLVPGAQSVRAVSRYAIFLALPLSILLAFILDGLLKHAGRSAPVKKKAVLYGLTIFAAGFIVLEQTALPSWNGFEKTKELYRLEYLSEKLYLNCPMFYVTVDPRVPYNATDIQLDAMLISAGTGIPTFNGYSGASPRDWWLYRVRSPKYGQYVKNWMDLHQIQQPACELHIDQ